jgi:hypothetical protein
MELTLSLLLRSIHKDGLLFDTLHDEQNLHLKEKVTRQGKSLLTPWLMKIINEGIYAQSFHISHLKTTLDFILIIIDLLYDTLYERMPTESLSHRLRMAEALIEKALGAREATIHISL